MARYLLERGADLAATDEKYGSTALHTASFNGHLEVATTLLDWGAHVDARNNNSLTPLHYAASNGHVELAKLFLARGADPYAKSRAGLTPLDKAQGRPTMVALLRDTIRRTGRRPGAGTLIPAAVRNDLRGILTALVAGEDVNATDDDGWTALHYAASLGLLAVTRLLLERGASQEVRDHAGLTASQVAAQAGRADVVQSLSDWAHIQVQRAHEEQIAAAATALAQAQAQMAANGGGGGGQHAQGGGHHGNEDAAPDMDVGPPEDGEDEGEWVATEEDYERYAQYLDDEAEDAGAFFRSKAGTAAMAAVVGGGGLVASPRTVKPRPVATAPPAMKLAPQAQPQGSGAHAVAHQPAPAAAAAAGAGRPNVAAPPVAAHEAVGTPGSALSAATAKVAADAADTRLDAHTRAAAAAQLRSSLAASRAQVEGQSGSVSSRTAPAGEHGGAAAPPASYTSRHDRRHRSHGSSRKGKGSSGGGSGMTQLRFWVTAAAAAATVLLLRAAMPSRGAKWEDEWDDDDYEDEPAAAPPAPTSGGVKSH